MKKILIIFFFVSLLKTTSGHVVETNSLRILRLEEEVKELQEQLHEVLVKQSQSSANPDIIGKVYFVTADLLYWYARTNGTAFAYSNHTTTVDVPLRGRTKDIDFDWQSGLRVGIGMNLGHDEWDLYAAFTLFRPHVSGLAHAGRNNTLVPLRGALVTDSGVTRAKSLYMLDTYQIDVELGRYYFVSAKLSLRPFAGIKNGWMKQHQIIRYTGGSVGLNTARVEDWCDYWGIGLRGGIESKWHLGQGVYLQGLFAGALLYGFFTIDHREKLTPSLEEKVKLSDNKHRFIPTIQWRMGIGWGRSFHKRKYYLNIGAAYEGMYWWRLNQMIKIYEYNAYRYDNFSDDLSMHGFTLMARWYF